MRRDYHATLEEFTEAGNILFESLNYSRHQVKPTVHEWVVSDAMHESIGQVLVATYFF
jgi:hypothetical protein